ncbi:thiol-disulfide oxidoreductase DCC family protein [Labrys monachus]|uniref:DCC family thiol-disulfide oxidoreductase YuxK n=1 Tax=Labrys monachus TaxID=217067 RepID=A0ABU0FNX6_9HYPH|nr:thiol-disulfide oxidoreductase DCC family protein [Labrys monachus]MDQ0396166.1 putative DCC family thiol-disulfide oxidoreductase YuxK [Labrys monachus]
MSGWKPRPAGGLPDGLVLFDGVCVLCSGWVHFILPRDPAGHFRFVAVQSAAGLVLAERFGLSPGDPQTVAVVGGGLVHFKGDALLAVLDHLPGWRWTRILRGVPRPIRDFAYDRVARNRYRWFGRRQACLLPGPGERGRFIDDPAALAGTGTAAAA